MDSLKRNEIFAILLFSSFRKEVRGIIDKSKTIGTFTPHGESHINGVEQSIAYLLKLQKASQTEVLQEELKLNSLELLLLRFCAWGHDTGMIQEIAFKHSPLCGDRRQKATDTVLREYHDTASALFIRETLKLIFARLTSELNRGRFAADERHQTHTVEACENEIIKELGKTEKIEEGDLREVLNYVRQDAHSSELLSETITLAHTVNLIAHFHRRAEPIEECPDERYLFGRPVRTKLLAAVFRLGDALHIDRTRFSQIDFDIFRRSPEFSEENRVHWIKSFIITSIRVNVNKFTVHIQADLPSEPPQRHQQRHESVDSIKLREMLDWVKTDLEEDVYSVSKILLTYGFPPLVGVTVEVHEIPAMEYPQDIRLALDHVLAAASPNTSQLIEIALAGLKSRLGEAANKASDADKEKYLCLEVGSHVNAIGQRLNRRTCHEGLRKVFEVSEGLLKSWRDTDFEFGISRIAKKIGRGGLLWTMLEGVYRVFADQRNRVNEGTRDCKFLMDVFEGCTDIILYGYSKQALNILEGVYQHEQNRLPKFHFLECRTKTLYSSAGQLVYLDGERYAKKLRQTLKITPQISLEPDVALGNIIQESNSTILLLGSNALYADGTFVHSLGHLTVASSAKTLNASHPCKVVVVTDGMKIGKTMRYQPEKRERNKKDWLTHNRQIVRSLMDQSISLHNWAEDSVPPHLVDHVVILDHRKVLRGPAFVGIDEYRFDPGSVFCKEITCRILAAVLAHSKRSPEEEQCIELFFPTVERNAQNWFVATEYLQNSLTALMKETNKIQSGQASRVLVGWIEQNWDAKDQEACAKMVASLAHRFEEIALTG